MATTVPFENELLKLIFNATPIPGVADNATTTPDTEYFVALHTEDPTKSPLPLQTSAEIAYTAYARQAVPRTELGWEIDQGKVIPVEIIEFPEVTGVVGSVRTATYFSVGTDCLGRRQGHVLRPLEASHHHCQRGHPAHRQPVGRLPLRRDLGLIQV